MKQYLDSEVLRPKVAGFFALGREVAAICHGVIVLARTREEKSTAKSPIHALRTTCLPKWMERSAYFMTAWKHGRYYRTYDAYVDDEVRAVTSTTRRRSSSARPFGQSARGTATDHGAAMVVEDGKYLSARWPGDAYLFAERFVERLGR